MAARNNKTVISAHPQGKFLEGKIYGTPKPGTCMSLRSAFADGNWHEWEPFSYTSGHRRLICVLTEDEDQGYTINDAYVSGTRGFLYCPIAGEELNMLIDDIAGTADDHTVGEQLMVQTGTGRLIVESSPEAEPFMLLQAITDPAADTLAPCMYTGY